MRNGATLLFTGLLLVASLATRASQAIVLESSSVGECLLSVETDEEWRTLRLRAHHPAVGRCAIDRDSMLTLLAAALRKQAPSAPAVGYETLYVGRLIDYPWMSRYLAATASRDSAWISQSGAPVSGDVNRYVDDLLSRDEFVAQIASVLGKAGYTVVGVTVEKVLVDKVESLPGRVPFDAQVWFRIAKR